MLHHEDLLNSIRFPGVAGTLSRQVSLSVVEQKQTQPPVYNSELSEVMVSSINIYNAGTPPRHLRLHLNCVTIATRTFVFSLSLFQRRC